VAITKGNYRELTERRLWAYNDIKVKIMRDIQDIEDLKKEKYLQHSRDIVRITSNGTVKVTPEELQQLRIEKAMAELNECKREIDKMDSLVASIADEPYSDIIPLKYFQRIGEQAIAMRLNCDISTVYRHKVKLLGRLMVRLYGVKAVGDESA